MKNENSCESAEGEVWKGYLYRIVLAQCFLVDCDLRWLESPVVQEVVDTRESDGGDKILHIGITSGKTLSPKVSLK